MVFYVMFRNCTNISALLETHVHPKQFKRIKSNIDIPWIQRTLYFRNNPAVFLKDQWLYSRRLLTEKALFVVFFVWWFKVLMVNITYGVDKSFKRLLSAKWQTHQSVAVKSYWKIRKVIYIIYQKNRVFSVFHWPKTAGALHGNTTQCSNLHRDYTK